MGVEVFNLELKNEFLYFLCKNVKENKYVAAYVMIKRRVRTIDVCRDDVTCLPKDPDGKIGDRLGSNPVRRRSELMR